MDSIIIHCPNSLCRKPVLKDATLHNGVAFKVKCYHCGHLVSLKMEYNKILLKDMTEQERELISFV